MLFLVLVYVFNFNFLNSQLPFWRRVYYKGLNYKDLYGNAMDLYKMVEINIILSIKSTYPAATCIVCHLPAFQANSK